MDERTQLLVRLMHCRGTSGRFVKRLLREDPLLRNVSELSVAELVDRFGIGQTTAVDFVADYRRLDGRSLVNYYASRHIRAIGLHESSYPPLLREIYDPPPVLYVAGQTATFMSEKMLAVVGTRRPSAEAAKILERLLVPLLEAGWTIVSGMAVGIDGMAHRLALPYRTIAVLGSGHFHPYPQAHVKLFQQMCHSQTVISEYAPAEPPARWRFPARNRLISGLSRGTLVVEAKARSGALITADQAIDQGREVFAVPGSLLDPNTAGTHALIQQGAKLVTCAEDILEELS
ncbi:MAG: DNA-processing protein DprA [Sporolactobacillus sp.]